MIKLKSINEKNFNERFPRKFYLFGYFQLAYTDRFLSMTMKVINYPGNLRGIFYD